MDSVTFDQVYDLAMKLDREEQLRLIRQLQANFPVEREERVTRESLLRELEELRAAGAFDNVESLYGKYADPAMDDLSAEELRAYLKEVGTEWEKEMDDLIDDD